MSNPPVAGHPIGVFDSGVGGLTVVRALRRRWPDADIIYLGDTARVPYGTKSAQVVERYALSCARFLVDRGATQLVIACNTASAFALPRLEQEFDLPVMGMILPGARAALAATQNRRVGIIATDGTIASESYQTALRALAADLEIVTQPCPLFVPLAEEGFVEHRAAQLIAEEYLRDVLRHGVDTLVLGCTHYPMLAPLIATVAGPGVTLIDSGEAAAIALERGAGTGRWEFFATDVSTRVQRVGSAFLGEPLPLVQHVDLEIIP
ncbi:MAG: glutamate racemase [Myxococcota bacterium]